MTFFWAALAAFIALAVYALVERTAQLAAMRRSGAAETAGAGGPVLAQLAALRRSGGAEPNAPAGSPYSARVIALAQAIAQAEGFYVGGSVPSRFNNPGDLGPGDCGSQYPSTFTAGSHVSQLPDTATGWDCLYRKLARIEAGRSAVFPLSMTFTEFAQKYAGDWRPWLETVEGIVEVGSTDTLGDYFSGAVGVV